DTLAHISADGTLDLSWIPTADREVDALAVSGSTVYIGGAFTTVDGSTRNRLAAVDTSTAALSSWNPNVTGGDGVVYSLAVSGSNVYAGGSFTTVNGATARNGAAAFSTATATATGFNPKAG